MNVNGIGSYIREQREQARISLRQLAQNAGISNPYLSQIERGLRRPSADILQQIAKGLRISAEALYVQAGFLEDRPPGSMVREAVMSDPELTQRQRQMLIEIYESFRKETAAAAALEVAAALKSAALKSAALVGADAIEGDGDGSIEDDGDSEFGPGEAELAWPEDVSGEAIGAAPAATAISPAASE